VPFFFHRVQQSSEQNEKQPTQIGAAAERRVND